MSDYGAEEISEAERMRNRRKTSLIAELATLRQQQRDQPRILSKPVTGLFLLGIVCLVGAAGYMVSKVRDSSEENSYTGDIREMNQMGLCPNLTRSAPGSVQYEYLDLQHSMWMHVSFDGQTSERISRYELAMHDKSRRATIEREERIVGGLITDIQRFPFYASLYSAGYGSHVCGGSIISRDWIVTAAHCVDSFPSLHSWHVHMGISSADQIDNTDYPYHFDSAVSVLVIHPNWDWNTFEGDIAMMKLETPISAWSGYIQPHCLLIPGHGPSLLPGDQVTVAGFGLTDEDDTEASEDLREVEIEIIPKEACNNGFGANWVLDDMVCAGDLDGGKDACQGDSGGPLSFYESTSAGDRWWYVGAVSFGVGCAREGLGGVYSSGGYYSAWLQDTMNHYDKFH